MRRLTALAALVLLFAAGCTGDDPGTGEEPAEESTAPAAPTAPVELELAPPTGFTADASGADREVLFAENHVTYTFYVAGAEGGFDRIQVTSYLLSEGTDTSTYETQATLVTDYFGKLNQLISLDNYYPTIVHRQDGIYRYGEVVVDGVEVKWQDHFVFAGPYLINVTCSWDAHYAQVDAACGELTSTFPFPEAFTAAAA